MLEKYLDEITKTSAKKIAVQLPEGLKNKALEVEEELKPTGAEVFFLGESNWGACDLRDWEAEKLNCDLLIHVGHSSFGIKPKVNTIFVEFQSDLDIKPVVEKAANALKETKIGLLTTIQHVHKIPEAEEILKRFHKESFTGKPTGSRSAHLTQILGCDYTAATTIQDKVDAFLYIGTGDFHPAGIAMKTNKPVYIADPERNEIRNATEVADKLLRRRFAKIELGKKAKTWGIVDSMKTGQRRVSVAKYMKEILEEAGKKAVIISMDEVSPEKLMSFRLDAYVNTSCSRIPTDDEARYVDTPMLTPWEVEIIVGKRKWEEYRVDHY